MRFISCFTIFFFAVISLYFGLGGVLKKENYNILKSQYNFESKEPITSDGIQFQNLAELALYEENKKAIKWFVFIDVLPEWITLVLTSCFFGMLGGVVLLLKEIALVNIKPENTKYVSIPLLGFFTGVLTLGLVYLVPTILTENKLTIRPVSLAFLSLFAGLYSTYFFDFITDTIKSKIYPSTNTNKNGN